MNIFNPLVSGSLSVSGSGQVSGDLTVLGTLFATISGTAENAVSTSHAAAYTLTSSFHQHTNSFNSFTSSYSTGSFTGSFNGNGGGLYNIPASGVTGLNLSQISQGSATASISQANGLLINTNTEITGNLKVNNINVGTNSLVTISVTDSGGKYFIDNVRNPQLTLIKGFTYKFLFPNIDSHPLKFSTTNDGSHNGGTIYSTGVTTGATPNYIQIEVTDSTPSTLYYYCTAHPGMGSGISVVSDILNLEADRGVVYIDPARIATTGSNTFIGAQSISGSASVTGALNITGSITLNGQPIGTGKLDETTFNSYTSSNELRVSALEVSTGSLNVFTSSIEQFTGSVNGKLNSLESSTSSLYNFTSSANSILSSLESASGSIRTDFNSYTSSNAITNTTQNDKLNALETTSGSINSYTSSNIANINAIHIATSSLNTFSSSVLGAVEITGSNLTVKGNLLVKGTTTQIDSTTLNIGDNIIQLNGTAASNGGLVVQDASGASTISGSLLWDTATDNWKAGKLGSEERIILVNEYNTFSTSIDSRASSIQTATASLNSYTASNDTRLGVIETTTGSLNSFTSSTNSKLNSLESASSSIISDFNGYTSSNNTRLSVIESTTSSLNSYTSSNNTRLGVIESTTGSLNTFTSSASSRLNSLESASGSIRTDFNSYTSSNNTRLGIIESTTGSLNTFTSSANSKLNSLESASGSIRTDFNSYTSSTNTSISAIHTSTSSLNSYTSSNNTRLGTIESTTGSLNTYTSSANTRFNTIESTTSSLNSFTNSINTTIKDRLNVENVISGSVQVTLSNTTGYSTFSSSLATTDAGQDNRLSSIEGKTGSYATTGSNVFKDSQTISGSLTITQNLIVQGSSSIQNISSSNLVIGTSVVTLNTNSPSARYAGIHIIDSGSVGGSGSFLYDAVQDEFIMVHKGNGLNVTSSHFIQGPQTYDDLGNEIYITANRIPKGSGEEHINDSNITDTGTKVSINSNTEITGTLAVTQNISSPNITAIQIATGSLNNFSSSVLTAIELTGSNLTVKGNLLVKGTTTNVNVTTLDVDNNLINLNGTGATNAGLRVKDTTGPNQVSGSLLWDASNDYWIAGQLGSEQRIVRETEFNNAVTRIGNVETSTGSLNSYTSSTNTRLGTIETATSSLNSYTSSTNTRLGIIETATASLNTFTSSASSRLNSLETASGSIRTDFNSYTSSNNSTVSTQNSRLSLIETSTGSLNTFTSSASGRLSAIESTTASLNSYTSSNTTNINAIHTATASLNSYTSSNTTNINAIHTATSSLNSYTSSNTTTINAINTATSSLNTFTSSFNSAFSLSGADVTVRGNFTVSGTTTTVNSTTVNIADNIIQLNGTGATNAGLVVRDATASTLTSGSLLWDTTNDKWIAGALGSEDDIVLRTTSQTLTNKTISGASNTLSNIGNGSLTNSSITIAGTSTSLGGSITAATILSGTGVVSGSAQLTSTFVQKVGDSMSGQLIIASTGTAGAATLKINTSTATSFIHSQENFSANMTAGQTNILVVGQAGSTKNAGYLGYNWSSSASNSNYVSLGHWGADNLLRVYGDGTVYMGTVTTGVWNGTAISDTYISSASNWNTAFSKRVTGVTLSSSTLTISAGDGTTVTASVPTFNQNTTGTAANITASSNTSLTSLANLATVGTITSGIWNGSSIGTAYTDAKITSVAGTSNQVNVSASTGAVTFSLPQNIHTSATPTFGGLTINGGATTATFRNTTASSNSNVCMGNDASANGAGIALLGSTFTSSGQYRANGGYIYSNLAGGLTLHAEGVNSMFLATNGTAAITINSSQTVAFSSNLTTPNTTSVGLQDVGGTAWFRPRDSANNLHIRTSSGGIYLDTNGTIFFRNVAGTVEGYIDSTNGGGRLMDSTLYANAAAMNQSVTTSASPTFTGLALGDGVYTYSDTNRDAGAAAYNPNAWARGFRFSFANASSTATAGNYSGVLHFHPWDGTTSSTGDASYQLAFGSTASNGGGTPQLRLRKGIDTTWNSWYTVPLKATASFTSVSSVTVTHNFNTKDVMVMLYDNNDEMFWPSTIVTTSVNVVTITFTTARTGRVVIIG